MSPSQPALRFSPEPHVHVAGERCPYCDQPIPNDKAEEIRARTEVKERERAEALTTRLTGEFARERAQIEVAAREAGERAAQAKAQERVAALEQANAALKAAMQEQVAEALRQRKAAVSQYETLKADHENVVSARVREAREALEKDKVNAVNATNAKHFEETQKLTDKLEDLKRQLERKTNEELGEGAEVDLFEALKAEFDDDRIERIGRGAPGADIRHVVIHNGKECGTILYDSKNRGAWRNDYVDKLARDQSAAEAEHAILSTLKLPGQTRQVHVDKGTGIIVANPARVLALAQMVRRHLVHVHTSRLSNTERAGKTEALYDFITSERCTRLLDSIDMHADDLLQLQLKEQKAHAATWKQQGMLYRSIQKARAEVGAEIERIIEAE